MFEAGAKGGQKFVLPCDGRRWFGKLVSDQGLENGGAFGMGREVACNPELATGEHFEERFDLPNLLGNAHRRLFALSASVGEAWGTFFDDLNDLSSELDIDVVFDAKACNDDRPALGAARTIPRPPDVVGDGQVGSTRLTTTDFVPSQIHR